MERVLFGQSGSFALPVMAGLFYLFAIGVKGYLDGFAAFWTFDFIGGLAVFHAFHGFKVFGGAEIFFGGHTHGLRQGTVIDAGLGAQYCAIGIRDEELLVFAGDGGFDVIDDFAAFHFAGDLVHFTAVGHSLDRGAGSGGQIVHGDADIFVSVGG